MISTPTLEAAAPHPAASLPAPRPYTRSERQRAASRRNICRAQQEAFRLMREPGYQPSPQRLAANHANLKLALDVKRHDRTYRYAGRFRDGLSAVSLERSLVLAGEKLDDYRAHLGWFQRVFAGPAATGTGELGPGAAGIHKLATALGQASWRRRRLFRTLPEWEMLAVCYSLRRLIEERRRGPALTALRLREWALELEGYTLLSARLSAERKARVIGNRVEALACQLLLEHGEGERHRRARRGQVVLDFALWSAEALGNSLRSAPQVENALAPHTVEIAGLESWRRFGSGEPSTAFPRNADGLELSSMEDLLLPRARRREAEGELAVPQCYADFLELVAAALGEGVEMKPPVYTALPVTSGRTADEHGSPELNELAQALWERLQFFPAQRERESALMDGLRRDDPENSPGNSDVWGTAAELAANQKLKSERLDFNQKSSAESQQSKDNCAEEPAGESDLPPFELAPLGPLTSKLVDGFAEGERAFRRVEGLEYRLQQAVYALLVKRFGELPEFQGLKPRPPDASGLLVRALLLNSLGRKAEAGMLLNLSNEIQAAAPGQPPRVRARGS